MELYQIDNTLRSWKETQRLGQAILNDKTVPKNKKALVKQCLDLNEVVIKNLEQMREKEAHRILNSREHPSSAPSTT